MTTDPLPDLLRSVHVRGATFCDVSVRDDWGRCTKHGADLMSRGSLSNFTRYLTGSRRSHFWLRTVLSVAKLSGGFLIAKRTFAGQGNFESDR